MSKKWAFTQNSLVNNLSFDQFRTITRLVNSKEIDPNHVLVAGRWNGSEVVWDDQCPTATVGDVLASHKVPNEKKPGEMRNNYDVLPNLNRVDAWTLQNYLVNAPIKGSNNGTIQPTVGQPNPKVAGFGGIAK